MSDRNPIVHRYLAQLDAGLDAARISEAERCEICQDIESHLLESIRSGASLSNALQNLGPADDLAQAYCLELTLNPRPSANQSTGNRIATALSRLGALLASTLLTIVMGLVSIGLLVLGAIAVTGGLIAPFLPPELLDPTLRAGLPQLVVIAFGVVLLAVGVPAAKLARVNLRILMITLRKQLIGGQV